jgi:hypothetical protein
MKNVMTFRLMAPRIRLFFRQQRASLVLPIVVMAALDAAVASPGTQASADTSDPCEVLSVMTVRQGTDEGPGSHSDSATSTNCTATLSLASSDSQDLQTNKVDCSVSTNSATVASGSAIAVQFSGECHGVVLSMLVQPIEPAGSQAQASSSSGSARADCKMIGKDIPGLEIFWNKSFLRWDYNNLAVSNPRHTVSRYDNSFWYLKSSSSGVISDGGTQFDAYDYAHWYSDGFPFKFMPDVEAWTQPHCDCPWKRRLALRLLGAYR